MTNNESHPRSDLDAMLDAALNALDAPDCIQFLYDDPHADPAAYLSDLPSFRALNNFYPATDADNDFYDRDDLLINDTIIHDLILAALTDALSDIAAALTRLQK